LNQIARIQTRFCHFNVMPRDRHDDFADQTDDVGIGATRDRSRNATARRFNCTFYRQACRVQDRST
jgi:hypothetical protein